MRSRLLALGALIAVIGGGTAYGVFAQGTPPQPPPPSARRDKDEKEPHPEMMRAKRQLQAAKESLQKSARDYHGHRTKAVGLIDQALKEIEAGIASDRH